MGRVQSQLLSKPRSFARPFIVVACRHFERQAQERHVQNVSRLEPRAKPGTKIKLDRAKEPIHTHFIMGSFQPLDFGIQISQHNAAG